MSATSLPTATLSASSIQPQADGPTLTLGDVLAPLRRRWPWLFVVPLVAGLLGYGLSFLVPPTFSAKASFLSPQAPNGASAALAALGGFASVAEGAIGGRSPAEQYAALLQSATVANRQIDRFELIKVYGVKHRVEARRELAENTRVVVGKRDGLITIEVEDNEPQRAADLANRYIHELRELTARLALSEAQQRRVFFENLLKKARDDLNTAQTALQGAGFNQSTLQAEPRAAADTFARAKAEVSAAEVRLQTLSRSLTDAAPEVQRAQAQLNALRLQLARAEQAGSKSAPSDYMMRYRELKYQETLFDLFARQFEAARVDEAREGLLIQVVDSAVPPEIKSRPKRSAVAMGSAFGALFLFATWLVLLDQSRSRKSAKSV